MLILVDADDRLLAGVDPSLSPRSGILDPQLRDALADRLRHTAELLHLGDVRTRPVRQLVSQPLHVLRTDPRVDRPGRRRLLLQQRLGVASDARGEVGRQRERLVERVGMQRQRVALRRSHSLGTCAGDVVEGILRSDRPPDVCECIGKETDFELFGSNLATLHSSRPARGFAPSMKKFMPMPQKNDRRGAKPASIPAFDVLDTVGEGVREFQVGRRTRFLDVVVGDRNRVEPRRFRASEREDVGDDPHRRLRWIDLGVADHELFENVVLDGPVKLLRPDALLLGGDDIQRKNRQHAAVHRHRDADLDKRDVIEQPAHIENGIDCHASHSDVTLNARVRVVATVGREVEGDRQALLPGKQVAAVEGIRIRGSREAGVCRIVHGWLTYIVGYGPRANGTWPGNESIG